MLILPRKLDLDKARADERKQEIDAGISLAKRVDELRRLKDEEERRLNEWRDNTLKIVRKEVNDVIEQKNNLKGELETLRDERKELLKPLNKEWEEINKVKERLSKEKENIYILKEQLEVEEEKIDKEKEKVSKIVSQITQKENETEKTKQNILTLKELAQKEYEIAHEEHISQTSAEEKVLQDLHKRKAEYESGIIINKKEEEAIKEKESELIIREKHLASQQVALRIAYEEVKKYGNRTT